jgi:uncharacterized protein (TIGR04222 family)
MMNLLRALYSEPVQGGTEMHWPLLDAIATMPGPQFLLLYACVIALTLFVCRLLLRRADSTAALPPPLVPSEPDPYEIAYLRGGERELTRFVICEMIVRGSLAISDGKQQLIQRAPDHPNSARLTSAERTLFEWFSEPRSVREAFRELPARLELRCEPYRQRLQSEHLLAPPDAQAAAWRARLVGATVTVGLGGSKLLAALGANHHNVGLLVAMMVASPVILGGVCPVPRLSTRGRAYLDSLRVAYGPLKEQALTRSSGEAEPAMLLLVGLFGVGVLKGTAYGGCADLFPKAASWNLAFSADGCGTCGSCGGCGGCGGCDGCGA